MTSTPHRTAAWKAAVLRELEADPGITFNVACAVARVSPPTVRAHAAADPELGRRLGDLREGRRKGPPPQPWQTLPWVQPLLAALTTDPNITLAQACARVVVTRTTVYELRSRPEFAAALADALGPARPMRKFRPRSPTTP